jgi:hypothetical protein
VWNRTAPQCVYPALTHCVSRVPGKFACRILIQEIGFALPVTIAVPVVVSLLIPFFGPLNDPCDDENIIPNYLFFSSPDFEKLEVRKLCSSRKLTNTQTPIIINIINHYRTTFNYKQYYHQKYTIFNIKLLVFVSGIKS